MKHIVTMSRFSALLSFTHKNHRRSLCVGVIEIFRKAFSMSAINATLGRQKRSRISKKRGERFGPGYSRSSALHCLPYTSVVYNSGFGSLTCLTNYPSVWDVVYFSYFLRLPVDHNLPQQFLLPDSICSFITSSYCSRISGFLRKRERCEISIFCTT